MPRRPSLLALVLAFASTAAAASPREDLHAAFSKFLAAKSFRATVVDVKKGQQISSMDFVAPDRYHIVTGQGQAEQVIVGDDAYTVIDGRSIRLPMPVGKIVGQYRNQKTLEQLEGDMTVQAAGSDTVDGEPANIYNYTISQPHRADVKVWISQKSGLPLQLESQGAFMGVKSTTRIRYFDYDDASIRVEKP
ncbi:hypothetical protein [Tahibacter amnicola]|uniref:Outer membrane lipoprotein-sorting protein n=1 Tax=Tahibacter amnicola TaxID=2976241 RepID=A0ABY6BGU8_9GAMM|nr:hypothetical protein [Tahibacter amnicola]UXI69089.1 hypothetical protein N4264_05410 [Tahibacter amnicola]